MPDDFWKAKGDSIFSNKQKSNKIEKWVVKIVKPEN